MRLSQVCHCRCPGSVNPGGDQGRCQYLSSPTPPPPLPAPVLSRPTGAVISVGDGDTLRMAYQGKPVTVRLACVDAPETGQAPYGPVARDRLRELLPGGLRSAFGRLTAIAMGRVGGGWRC
jgi:endonuclease YncB( thermonuclease family)